jgi:hypothetical protein
LSHCPAVLASKASGEGSLSSKLEASGIPRDDPERFVVIPSDMQTHFYHEQMDVSSKNGDKIYQDVN